MVYELIIVTMNCREISKASGNAIFNQIGFCFT